MTFQIYIENPKENKTNFILGVMFGKSFKEYDEGGVFECGKKILEINSVLSVLKEIEGVYYTGDIEFEHPTLPESSWIKYTLMAVDLDFIEYILINNNRITFNNKIHLEEIMAKNKAPYKIWSIIALKNECKRRKFAEDQWKTVKTKDVLAELLTQDDLTAGGKTDAPAEKPAEKKADKKAADKKADPKKDKKADPKKDKKADTKKDEKAPAKATGVSAAGLNQSLRDKGLWVKGAQFLSTSEKQALLKAKTQKARQVMYDALEKKVDAIKATLSKKMKASAAAKKAELAAEPKKEKKEYADMDLNALRKLAVKRKDELKALNLSAKKSDTVEDLAEKLTAADEAA